MNVWIPQVEDEVESGHVDGVRWLDLKGDHIVNSVRWLNLKGGHIVNGVRCLNLKGAFLVSLDKCLDSACSSDHMENENVCDTEEVESVSVR